MESSALLDPESWARAFSLVPVGWRLAAVGLLAFWIYALVQKWKPRDRGRLP